MTPTRLPQPTLLPALALVFLALGASCKGGCAGCGADDEPDQSAAPAEVPEDWAALTRGYAEQLPTGTHGLIVARGFEEVAAGFATIKERIRDFFDLGQVESEIRNTFGVDIHRRVTFREVGVAYDGGFAVATVLQQPVVGFYLTDAEAFFGRASEVLRRQPFNLRAPVVSEQVGEAEIRLFSRRLNEPVEFAVVSHRGFGFLIPRASHASEVPDVARVLAETTPETSLAAHPDFEAQVSRFSEYPGFGFVDTVAASSFYAERLADQLSTSSAHALAQVQSSLSSVAGGARLDGLIVTIEAYVAVTAEVAATAEGIEVEADEDPGLGHFFLPSTFAAVRLGADLMTLWRTLLQFQGEGGAAVLSRHLEELEELLGATLEEDLETALTGQMLVMINRLAPLSLMRAQSPADYFDAVDLLAVLEVADPARILAIFDGLVERSEGAYQKTEDAGGIVRLNTGRSEDSFGNLWLKDGLLVFGADRMTRVVNRLLNTPIQEGSGEVPSGLGAHAQSLLTAPVTSGAFLTFDRLVPIATLLNYPQVVRDLLAFLETLVVSMEPSGQGLHLTGSLTFTPAEVE